MVKYQKVFKYYVHDCNSKQYSNTADSIKLIREIIIPYIEKERISLKLFKNQPPLLIMDVFRGQTIEDALTPFKDNNIRAPANMTHFPAP